MFYMVILRPKNHSGARIFWNFVTLSWFLAAKIYSEHWKRPIFGNLQSKGLTRYKKILRWYLFGCKDLLNFPCITRKFHDWHHTNTHTNRLLTFVCHFMKHKCYFQRGVAECKQATTPLSSYSINTTQQGFQKSHNTLLYLKGLKSYQPSKYKCLHFTPLSLVNQTFHLHFSW